MQYKAGFESEAERQAAWQLRSRIPETRDPRAAVRGKDSMGYWQRRNLAEKTLKVTHLTPEEVEARFGKPRTVEEMRTAQYAENQICWVKGKLVK